jgi:hypothetical protein
MGKKNTEKRRPTKLFNFEKSLENVRSSLVKAARKNMKKVGGYLSRTKRPKKKKNITAKMRKSRRIRSASFSEIFRK